MELNVWDSHESFGVQGLLCMEEKAVGGGKTGWIQIKERVRRAYILVTRIKYREFKRNQSHPDSRCQTDSMTPGPREGRGSYCSFRRFTPAKTDCPLG